LAGSQTEIALITSDFIKIYDLNEDSISPKYFFLIPIGKIRDCTFLADKGNRYVIIMSSTGYMYYESLNGVTSNGRPRRSTAFAPSPISFTLYSLSFQDCTT
jgi:hypothetical protein